MFAFRKFFAKSKQPRRTTTRQARRSARRPLVLEPLEARLVPTVVFDPQFSKETVPAGPYTVLNSPTVYLIFWGTGWGSGNLPGPSAVNTLTTDARAVLSSAYFGGLSEYGNVGTPVFGGAWTDSTSDPPAGFNVGTPGALTADQGEIATAITNNPSWSPLLTQVPIYVVIPVGGSSGINGQGTWILPGTTAALPIHICSVGGASDSSGNTVQDWFTQTYSHEVAERITDPTDPGGVRVNYPTDPFYPGYYSPVWLDVNNSPSPNPWDPGFQDQPYANNSTQIGDGEQEIGGQAHYGYRETGIVDGKQVQVKVQSFLSAKTLDESGNAGAFVVPDGNSETIYLDPIWATGTIPGSNPAINGPYFTGNYNLVIWGDHQSSTAADDVITINANDAQVKVTLDGQNFLLDTFYDGGQIKNIRVEAGGGTNTINLQQLAKDQTVYVLNRNFTAGTSHAVDTVNIGNSGDMSGMLGTVYVYNSTLDALSTTLNIDDSKDSVKVGRTVTMGPSASGNSDLYSVSFSGLGTVNYSMSNVKTVTVSGGPSGNTFKVLATGSPLFTINTKTVINTGAGRDTVAVATTKGPLQINGSTGTNVVVGDGTHSLDSLQGPVTVSGGGGTTLTIDDRAQADRLTPDGFPAVPASTTYTLSAPTPFNGQLVRTALEIATGGLFVGLQLPSTAILSYSDLAGLTLDGYTNAPNVFAVQGTQSATTLQAGAGNDTVTVGDATHSLDSLHGQLTVAGGTGTTMTVDDRALADRLTPDGFFAQPVLTTYTLSAPATGNGQLVRTALEIATGGLFFGQQLPNTATLSYSNLAGLTLDGYTNAANNFAVQATLAGTPVTLNTGKAGDTVVVGSAANTLGDIQGALTGTGQGNTTLTFNDLNGNPGAAPQQNFVYSLAQNTFRRTGTATVTFSGMAKVNLQAANAANTGGWNGIYVSSTAAGTSYQVNAGTGENEYIVEDTSETLNGFQGPLYLHGAGGTLPNNDFVFFYDVDKITHHTLVLTADGTSNGGFIQRDGVTNIHYDGLDSYMVLQTAGSIGATVDVQSEAPNLYTGIFVGSPDKVTIGNTSHTMAGIAGDIRIAADVGTTPSVTLDDAQDPNGETVTLSNNPTYGYQIAGLLPPSSVGRGRIWLEQGAAMQATLLGGNGNDTFTVDTPFAANGITINGGGGTNALVVDDRLTTTDEQYNISAQQISVGPWTSPPTPPTTAVSYVNFATVAVYGGGGNNGFFVDGTPAGTAVSLYAGTVTGPVYKDNSFVADGWLDRIQGPLALHGAPSSVDYSIARFNDSSNPASYNYTLSASSLARSGPVAIAPISFDGLTYAILYTGTGTNKVAIPSVATSSEAIVAGQTGTAITVGSPVGNTGKHTLQNILGSVVIGGAWGTSTPTVLIDDSGNTSTAARTVSFDQTAQYGYRITGLTAVPMYVNLPNTTAPVTVRGNAGNEQFVLNSLPSDGTWTVDGQGGSNTLTGPNLTNAWAITGANKGTVDGMAFTGFQNLVGGTGVDTFKFGAGGSASSVNGGGAPAGQGDWLDYSSFTTPVTVNLATGSATNVNGGAAGAVTNIQNVHGGNHGNTLTGNGQGNILIGGSGSNTITGGSGMSILIADKGPSTITGGSSGGDILIGDYTTYDAMTTANELALMSILAEWQSADSYAVRFHDINTGTGGGLNGTAKLNWGTTVKDDGTPDAPVTLTAAPSAQALDWFFLDTNDTKVNYEAGEHVNNT
jgi:hypothetical protein